MRIVGIDPSLQQTGVCILEAGQPPETLSIRSKKQESVYRRQRQILSDVKDCLLIHDIVVLEDFGISARFAPSGCFCERLELLGMLKLMCPAVTHLPWLSMAPTMLKRFVTGKGTAHKDEVEMAVRVTWGVPVHNDDEADAYGLARYAQAVLYEEPAYASRREKFEAYGVNGAHLKAIRSVHTRILQSV